MADRRRILLVDDLPMFRQLGALFLTRTAPVQTAATGDEAIAIATSDPPRVVITDCQLSDMDGATLCRVLKSQPETADCRVIIVGRANAQGEHARAVLAGADDVLHKPLERTSLIAAVHRLLQGGVPLAHPRAGVAAPVEVRGADQSLFGILRNVSRSGALVEIEEPLEKDAHVCLDFALPEIDVPLSPTARVVWSRMAERAEVGMDGRGSEVCEVGMRFIDIDAGSIARLENFVFDRQPVRIPGTLLGAPIR